MIKRFITFGSHDNYISAGNRLIEQAQKLDIFTESTLYTPEFLQSDAEFWNQHQEFIITNKRGYGYWLWKPFVIKKTMEKMSDGDILLYLDCGCELDCKKKDALLKFFDDVKTEKIIGSSTRIERDWNKMDLIVKLDMSNNTCLDTSQNQAGALLFLVCSETRKLLDEWYTLACDYHNIDDSPSVLPNFKCFKEHRHDQSIFSLLTKKYNLFGKQNLENGVYYIRNKTGASTIRSMNSQTVRFNRIPGVRVSILKRR
jgi:hypothetical protein